MQVNCPNCGAKVSAENINIQKMTAVCGACDAVFSFDLPEPKSKRRKVKQPVKLTVRDAETLHIEFLTNFKLGRNETFIISLIGSIIPFGIGMMLVGQTRVPFFLPAFFLAISAIFVYTAALTAVNKTHIDMDEDSIKVSRKPLPNPLGDDHEVSLAGVTAIKYEETAISKKEGYDLPRYVVWAETEEGIRRTIVNDVIEEYAVYIAQRLQERLPVDDDMDVSRLEDGGQQKDDEADIDEAVRASQNNARR
jgi:hypothetical protein